MRGRGAFCSGYLPWEGNQPLRLASSGRNRGILLFDTQALSAAVGTTTLVQARLELTIDVNSNNRGTTGRPVGACRLTKHTTEYDSTFNCAIDASVYNSAADWSGATAWTMWSTSNPSLHPSVEP